VVCQRFKARGDNGDANDTNTIITRIVKLRAERASLLGYPSHAHLQMADSMAGSPERARALLFELWTAAVAKVGEEVARMQAIASADDPADRPWDYSTRASPSGAGRRCGRRARVRTGPHDRGPRSGQPPSAIASRSRNHRNGAGLP
jgi:hypothetical protein